MPNPLLAKTVISCGVPKLIEHAPDIIKAVWCRLFPDKPKTEELDGFAQKKAIPHPFYDTDIPPKKKKRKIYKKRDSTKFTVVHLEYARKVHAAWYEYNNSNPGKHKNQDELVDFLNRRMDMDKSRTAMATLWNGRINKEDLPEGEVYFDNENF